MRQQPEGEPVEGDAAAEESEEDISAPPAEVSSTAQTGPRNYRGQHRPKPKSLTRTMRRR